MKYLVSLCYCNAYSRKKKRRHTSAQAAAPALFDPFQLDSTPSLQLLRGAVQPPPSPTHSPHSDMMTSAAIVLLPDTAVRYEQVVKKFWQKAASPTCHPSRLRMVSEVRRWVTIRGYAVFVCNQPLRPTQLLALWLPVHRDQLRAQRSVTSMGELYLFYRSKLISDSNFEKITWPLKFKMCRHPWYDTFYL